MNIHKKQHTRPIGSAPPPAVGSSGGSSFCEGIFMDHGFLPAGFWMGLSMERPNRRPQGGGERSWIHPQALMGSSCHAAFSQSFPLLGPENCLSSITPSPGLLPPLSWAKLTTAISISSFLSICFQSQSTYSFSWEDKLF